MAKDLISDADQQRETVIQQVALVCLHRLDQGEIFSDESIQQAHSDLMPELAAELIALRRIHAIRRLAERADLRGSDRDERPGVPRNTPSDADAVLTVRCPECHTPMRLAADSDLQSIVCASCGGQFSVLGRDDKDLGSRLLTQIGRFDLLEQIGTGGFGTVWKARDPELDRLVAIKIPRRGNLNASEAEQFFREARAAAQLRHPHIVSVHEVGCDNDTTFIVSDFIDGRSLAERLAHERMTADEAAELCARLAQALQHAHDSGVIHRDLKPANILLDGANQPYLTDFGLARRVACESTVTLDGQVVGTPSYMSPEQARGDSHTADHQSDVYSLGVILFELLTGDVPFHGSVQMIAQQIIENEPPSPRGLNATIPKDLATICLKCLEKEPKRRYDTAKDLAQDLGCYLRHEPIHARAVSSVERAWRWCRRKPAVAGLGSLAAALVIVLVVAATLVARREVRRRHEAVSQQRLLRRQLYAGDMDAAMRAWQEANPPLVDATLDRWRPQLGQEDLRGFEWYYLWRNCQRGRESPSHLHSVPLDDCLTFTGDGHYVAALQRDSYLLLDARTAVVSRQEELPVQHASWLEMSADGSFVGASGTADGKPYVRLWRFIPELHEVPLQGPCPAARRLLFSQDSGLFAAASIDGTVRFWDAASGKPAGQLASGIMGLVRNRFSGFNILAIASDHRLMVVVVDQTQLSLWDIVEARKLHDFAGHGVRTDAAAFTRDGSLLATGSQDNTIKLWNTASGALVHTLMGHNAGVVRVDFSPDGRRLVSASDDNTVRVWDVIRGAEVETLRGHAENVPYVAFAPDGNAVASHGNDDITKIWRIDRPHWREFLSGHRKYVHRVALAPDDTTIASGDTDGEICVWDAGRGERILTLPDHQDRVQSLAFSPDGQWLASSSVDHAILLWATATWKPMKRIEHPSAVPSMAIFSPDGHSLIVARDDGMVSYRRVGDGFQEYHRFDTGEQGEVALAVSPDCKLLATGHRTAAVKLWDFQSSQPLGMLSGPTHAVTHVEFSPDGQLLAASEVGGGIRVWDVAARQIHAAPMQASSNVLCVRFLPDGKTLVSSEFDRSIRMWDVVSGTKRGVLRAADTRISDLAVSKSGRLLVTADYDLKVRLWRAASPAEVLAAEKSTPAKSR